MRTACTIPLILVMIAGLTGCSGGGDTPVTPADVEQVSNSAGIQEDQHSLLGIWSADFDVASQQVSVTPLRHVDFHYNVTDFMTPPQCPLGECFSIYVESYKPQTKIMDLQVILRNTTSVTAYDPRLIFFDSTTGWKLANPDDYTDLYAQPPGSINPFRAFADDATQRKVEPESEHSEEILIYFGNPPGSEPITFALTVNWPGNCKDPIQISEFVQDWPIPPDGGSTEVNVFIMDWQYDVSGVYIDMTPLGGELTEMDYVIGLTWAATVETDQANAPGFYDVLISAGSMNTSLKLYDYVQIEVGLCFPEDNETWVDATEISVGADLEMEAVCIDDLYDWYQFDIESLLGGDVTLHLTSETGSAGLGFYDDPTGDPLGWAGANFGFDGVVDLGSLELGPGTYYLRVGFIGTDEETRVYDLVNNVQDIFCFPDDNDDYSGAIEIEFDNSSGIQYVCLDDKEDWFKFDYIGQGGKLRLNVLNSTGPADITLYNEAQAPTPFGPNIAQVEANPTATIDLEDLSLPSATYFTRIRHVGVDDLDREYEMRLILTPFQWANSWGSTSHDTEAMDFLVDNVGNIYVAGYYYEIATGVDFDPGDGMDIFYTNGQQDTFFVKYNSDGVYQWGRTWGAEGRDHARAVGFDAYGDVVVGGSFQFTVDFDPGPGTSNETAVGDYTGAYLSRFDTDGNFIDVHSWHTSDEGRVLVREIGCDDTSAIYAAGTFDGDIDFDPGPMEDIRSSGPTGQHIFLCKYDTSGNYLWVRSWGSSGWNEPLDILVDGTSIYITGSYEFDVDFNPGIPQELQINNGHYDAFICKYNSTGDYQWVKTWGADQYDDARGMASDTGGNIVVTGKFTHTVDFDPGPGVTEYSPSGEHSHCYVSGFTPSGNFIDAIAWDDYYTTEGRGLVVDDAGNVYLTGWFRNTVDFDPGAGIAEHVSQGANDAFTLMIGSSGNFAWAMSWGGEYDICADSPALDDYGGLYVLGNFKDLADLDPGPGIDEHDSGGYHWNSCLSKFLIGE